MLFFRLAVFVAGRGIVRCLDNLPPAAVNGQTQGSVRIVDSATYRGLPKCLFAVIFGENLLGSVSDYVQYILNFSILENWILPRLPPSAPQRISELAPLIKTGLIRLNSLFAYDLATSSMASLVCLPSGSTQIVLPPCAFVDPGLHQSRLHTTAVLLQCQLRFGGIRLHGYNSDYAPCCSFSLLNLS